MKNNLITFENYMAHRQAYGHISTWALWNENILTTDTKDMKRKNAIRHELLIANSAAEYEEKGLNRHLHGNVIILALNFSCPKESKKGDNPILNILNQYKDERYNKERYEALVRLLEKDDQFTFFNMYDAAARYYAPTFMASEFLHGAYMTDFVKFVEVDGQPLPAGIPDSNSDADIVKECLSKDNISLQAQGFKNELDLLGIKPKVIIPVSSKLNNNRVRDAISDALGYRPHFEQLHHYIPRGSSYVKRGYSSYDEMFAGEIKDLLENIGKKWLQTQ